MRDFKNMKIVEDSICTGCSLCQNVCPKQAITMGFNEDGFLIPTIDEEKCINCGLCEKSCIKKSSIGIENKIYSFYKGHSPYKETVSTSSSGGAFTELASVILGKGGVVFGAVYNTVYTVKHVPGESLTDVERMRHSKYIQSDASGTYKLVKLYLKQNRDVLFVGTPCQVFSLKKYLKTDYPNLYLVDLLCFGVMSTGVFKSYVEFICHKNDILSQNIQVNFRKKGINDYPNAFTIERDNDVLFAETFHGATKGMGYLFGSRLAVRESCQNCAFQCENRCGDITLGDYVYCTDTTNDYNTSLIITNSLKGDDLLHNSAIQIEPLKQDEIDFSRKRLNKVPISNPKRYKFLLHHRNFGFDDSLYNMCEYKPASLLERLMNKISIIYGK